MLRRIGASFPHSLQRVNRIRDAGKSRSFYAPLRFPLCSNNFSTNPPDLEKQTHNAKEVIDSQLKQIEQTYKESLAAGRKNKAQADKDLINSLKNLDNEFGIFNGLDLTYERLAGNISQEKARTKYEYKSATDPQTLWFEEDDSDYFPDDLEHDNLDPEYKFGGEEPDIQQLNVEPLSAQTSKAKRRQANANDRTALPFPNEKPFHFIKPPPEKDVYHMKYNGYTAIILNRPKQKNALSLESIREFRRLLKVWDYYPETSKLTWLTHRGETFCSGSDVKSLYEHVTKKDFAFLRDYFREEFHLWHDIKRSRTPIVSLLNAPTIGSGAGFVHNALIPIASPGAVYSIPETGYGLIPYAGSTYALSRLKDGVGNYLALTGKQIVDYNLLHVGLSGHYFHNLTQFDYWGDYLSNVYSPRLADIHQGLMAHANISIPKYIFSDIKPYIKKSFTLKDPDELLGSLLSENISWAHKTHKDLLEKSPLCFKLGHRLLTMAKKLTFEQCLSLEYRVLMRLLRHPDFEEGFKARVLDNRPPIWTHRSPEDVTNAEIESFLAPFEDPSEELDFPEWDTDHIRSYPRFDPIQPFHTYDFEKRIQRDTGEEFNGTILNTGHPWKALEIDAEIERNPLPRDEIDDLMRFDFDRNYFFYGYNDKDLTSQDVDMRIPQLYMKRGDAWVLNRAPKEYDVDVSRIDKQHFDSYLVFTMLRKFRELHDFFPLLRDLEQRY